jgi:hypothetical protein
VHASANHQGTQVPYVNTSAENESVAGAAPTRQDVVARGECQHFIILLVLGENFSSKLAPHNDIYARRTHCTPREQCVQSLLSALVGREKIFTRI